MTSETIRSLETLETTLYNFGEPQYEKCFLMILTQHGQSDHCPLQSQ